MKLITPPRLILLAGVGLALASGALAQVPAQLDLGDRSFQLGDTGTANALGVDFRVRPEIKTGNVVTFLVAATYTDPYLPAGAPRQVVPQTLVSGACRFDGDTRIEGPYRWGNSRDVRFSATLVRRCEAVPLAQGGSVLIARLETQLSCSDAAGEARHIGALKEGRIFDIVPATHAAAVPNIDRQAALDVEHKVGQVVTVIQTVFKLVKVVEGVLTVEGFLVQVAVDFLEGQVTGLIEDAVVKYVVDQAGTSIQLQPAGWSVYCRLCGKRFVLAKLEDGQILVCPNQKCIGRARVHLSSAALP